MSSLFVDEPLSCITKELLRRGTPILAGMESMKAFRRTQASKTSCWVKVLETTRILLAHCSISLNNEPELLDKIAVNIRNLYLLFGLNLSEKEKWRGVESNNAIYYVEPNNNGKFFIDLENPVFCESEYEVMFTEFNCVDDNQDLKNIIGHCIYVLIATDYTDWMKSCRLYRDLIPLVRVEENS
jgi:hypothetical protein